MSRRSREIGWGPAEITLWEIQRSLNCSCKPASTGVNCAPGGFWVNHEDDLYTDNAVNYGNTAIDSSCNVYSVWGVTSTLAPAPPFFLVEKRSSSGTMLWQKSYTSPDVPVNDVNNLAIDGQNNLIVSGDNFIAKINSTTGAVLWSYSDSVLGNLFRGANVDSDNNVVIDGNLLFDDEYGVSQRLYMIKLNGSTGALINESAYYIDAQGTSGVDPYSLPWTDKNKGIYALPTFSFGPLGYQAVAIKFDTNLNHVFNVKILDKEVIGGDQDGTAIRLDDSGNIYFNDYSNAVIKTNSSGVFVWAADFNTWNSMYDVAVGKDGSVYTMQEVDNQNLQIAKLSATDGSLIWAINLENTTDGVNTWISIPYTLTYYNNVLCLQSEYNTLKISVDGITAGTYGNFVVTDVTSTTTVTNPTVPLTSVTVTPLTTTYWATNAISSALSVADTTYTQTNTTI